MKKLVLSLMLLTGSQAVLAGDCRGYFSNIYDMYDLPASVNGISYHVQSVRLYHDGNISFAMNEHYNPDYAYFNDRAAEKGFDMILHPNSDWGGEAHKVGGKFRDMFPSKNAAPLTTLTLFRSGEAQITLNEEDNRVFYLEGLDCYGMNKNRFVIEGKVKVPPYVSSWMFTVERRPSQ